VDTPTEKPLDVWRRDTGGTWALPVRCGKCRHVVMTVRTAEQGPPQRPRLRAVHSGWSHRVVEQTPDGYWRPYIQGGE
jgi:hypothetical protein